METNENKLKLSPPWAVFYRKVCALFGNDPAIEIAYDEDAPAVRLRVEGEAKADAISKLLPHEKAFGNVTLKIEVIPANDVEETVEGLFEKAFDGNPAFAYAQDVEGVLSNPMCYVVFKPEVVQYFNDDLGDIHGICSTLYQNIAADLFEGQDGAFYCTDIANKTAFEIETAEH